MARVVAFNAFSALIGVVILILSVFAGVYLVKQEQNIANRAEELREHKVNVCHKTGSQSNPWVQIEISENAMNAHLEHGDIQGNCPGEGGKDDENKPTSNPTPTSVGIGGVSSTTVVNVNNQTITPAPEIEIVKEYVYVTTRFDFKIKFQGINEKKPDKIVRVIFRKGDEELHVYNKVVVTSDKKGIYRGTITDVRPGVWEVLIKGDGYLQKRFEKVNLVRGRNTYDWTEEELLAGDFDLDNDLDAKDIAEFMSFFNEDLNPVTDENKIFDLDMNGFLNLEEMTFVFTNLNTLRIVGDN